MKKLLAALLTTCLCSACSLDSVYNNDFAKEAQMEETTHAGRILASLPAPLEPVPVVVYEFGDQTGQFKSNDNFVEYSTAVTKGGLAVLMKALLDTSNGRFFTVAERGGLNNLLQERKIIRTMRNEFAMPDGSKAADLPPMLYGAMIIEGGIVFYDSNTLTGGAAAGYFGISGSTQYRRDIVTVYLRAVDVQTGKVMLSVNSSKTIFSYGVSTNVLRYFSVDRLFAAEGGYTVNEPGQLAVRQAIESAVYSLTMEGASRGMWGFTNPVAGKKAVDDYIARRDKDKPQDELEGARAQQTPHGMARMSNAAPMAPAASSFPGDTRTGAPQMAADGSQCGGFSSWWQRNFSADEPETVVNKRTKLVPTTRNAPAAQGTVMPTKSNPNP